MPSAATAKPKAAKKVHKVQIDITEAVKSDVMRASEFEKFLSTTIKVGGKAGALGDAVTVSADASGNRVTVSSSGVHFAKRYFKYLTKKYLKKSDLREYLRVVANSKTGYALKFYKLAEDEEA